MPTLTAKVNGLGTPPYKVDFQVATDSAFTNVISDSGWLVANIPYSGSLQKYQATYAVPDTANLQAAADGTKGPKYYVRAQAKDSTGATGSWSTAQGFWVALPNLGTADQWPIWKHDGISVNLANGNTIIPIPGFSIPTVIGDMGIRLSKSSNDQSNDHGLGQGVVLDTGLGGGVPHKLIDHSLQADGSTDVEVDWTGGKTEWFGLVGDSFYKPKKGTSPTSYLAKSTGSGGSGNFTLTEGNTVYDFNAEDTTGIAHIADVKVVEGKTGQNGSFTVGYDAGSASNPHTISDPGGRTLQLDWPRDGCTYLLCAKLLGTGGNVLDQLVYVKVAGATVDEIGSVVDMGTLPLSGGLSTGRTLVQYTWDSANKRIIEIQNANDLAPSTDTNLSDGYDQTHSIQLTYFVNSLKTLTDSNISDQGSTRDSKWSFTYTTSAVTLPATAAAHAGAAAGTQRTAWGQTTIMSPNQQPSGSVKTYAFDDMGQTMMVKDEDGNYVQMQYNRRGQLLWSENQQQDPTDNTWDPYLDVQTLSEAPPPVHGDTTDSHRPHTYYRYDEQKVGTSSSSGPLLQSLQASYFNNLYEAGAPDFLIDDPVGPTTSLTLPWANASPPQSTPTNISIRWKGFITPPLIGNNDYTFSVTYHGGVRVTVGDNVPLSDWNNCATSSGSLTSQTVTLNQVATTDPAYPIRYPITIDYCSASASATVQLNWSYTGHSSAAIPMSSFIPGWTKQTSTVDPVGRVAFSHFADPALGQPDYTLMNDGTNNVITTFTYDKYGNVLEEVQPKGNAGRTIDSSGNLGGTPDTTYATDYVYYTVGETASSATCGGSAVNQSGELKSKTPHGITATSYVYDALGRMIAVTKAVGTTCNTYAADWNTEPNADLRGRLKSTQAPDERAANPPTSTTYTYDPMGAVRTATNANGTVTTNYDEAGRVQKTTDSFGASSTMTYDADGDPISRASKASSGGTTYTTSYGPYDAADRLTQMTDPAGRVYKYWYTPNEKLKAVQYPNGTFSWKDFNGDGQTTGLYVHHGTLPSTLPGSVPADSQNSPIVEYSYSYNLDGTKSQETRQGTGGLTQEITSYAYDSLGRLSQVTLPDTTVRQYTYDLDSNRTSIIENSTTVATYTYNTSSTPGVDQLTSITGQNANTYDYDSDGNVTTRGSDTLTWDGRGRLNGGTFSGATVSYKFDATGFRRQRVSGSTTTNYLLGGAFETDGANVTLTAVAGIAGDLAHYSGVPTTSSTVSFLYYNDHGDLSAEADINGTRAAAYTYDPFGGIREGSTPTNATAERWVGAANKKLDTASGLIEMGARPYDSATGRFYAVDPVDGGSANNYDYALQDPVNRFDLSGELPNWVCYVGCAVLLSAYVSAVEAACWYCGHHPPPDPTGVLACASCIDGNKNIALRSGTFLKACKDWCDQHPKAKKPPPGLLGDLSPQPLGCRP